MTLNKLRVPLLIYKGKILQDYQSGLRRHKRVWEEFYSSVTALEVFCLWNVGIARAVAVVISKIPTTSQE